jgi:sulfide:quinone oxidoreductase
VERKGIEFLSVPVVTPGARAETLTLADGQVLDYDYLVIATGPELAFDEIPGLGPDGHSHSICTTPHAERAGVAYQTFLENPGPVVVGAVQGASCFGPPTSSP